MRVALVGDFDASVPAHQAIPRAIELAAAGLRISVKASWVATDAMGELENRRGEYNGFWLVPASPYRSFSGALNLVRWAREGQVPFLGTCGGFQHAVLEIARDLAGLPEASHSEIDPTSATPVISTLSCPLVETVGRLRFLPGSRIQTAYAAVESVEGYHCRFGFNEVYRERLESAGMKFTAFDDSGAIRGGELAGHPFFVGTLFQPERRALRGEIPPLVTAWLQAGASRS